MAQPLYPSFTPTYHHTQYPAIDPTQPHLDCSDKIILITGAGAGIGQGIAIGFAQAHTKGIALIGRTLSTLEETASLVASASTGKTDTFIATADITNEFQVIAAFEQIVQYFDATPDVLVNNAGGLLAYDDLASISLSGFRETFDLNVMGSMTVTQSFIRFAKVSSRSDERRVIINISSGSAHLPYSPKQVAYASSKLANAKVFEHAHFEHPDWLILNVQPGVVATAMAKAAGRSAPDDANLVAGFAVWLTKDPRAEILNGRFVWANWDVEELVERLGRGTEAEEGVLMMGLKGWADGYAVDDLVGKARSVFKS